MTKMRPGNDLPKDVTKQFDDPSWSYGTADNFRPPTKKNYGIDPPVFASSLFRTVGTTAVKLLGTVIKRRILAIQNFSSNNVWIGVAAAPQVNGGVGTGFLIPSNGYLEWNQFCPVNDIFAISDAAGSTIVIMEGLYDEFK